MIVGFVNKRWGRMSLDDQEVITKRIFSMTERAKLTEKAGNAQAAPSGAQFPLLNTYNILKHHALDPSIASKIVQPTLSMCAYLAAQSEDWKCVLATREIQIFLPDSYLGMDYVYAPVWMAEHSFVWEEKTVFLGDFCIGVLAQWSTLLANFSAPVKASLRRYTLIASRSQFKPLTFLDQQTQTWWCGKVGNTNHRKDHIYRCACGRSQCEGVCLSK